MRTVPDHEFVADEQGDMALLMDVLSFDPAEEPVLLVSSTEDKAYLRRSPGDVHEITGINPDIIGQVRKAQNMVVLEILGETVTHTYGVDVAPLEEEVPAV